MLSKNDDIKKVEITLHTDNGVYTYTPEDYVILFEGEFDGDLGLIGSADIKKVKAAKLFVCKLMEIVQGITDSIEKEELKRPNIIQNAMWAFPYFANNDLEGFRKDENYNKADKNIISVIEEIIIENKKGDN